MTAFTRAKQDRTEQNTVERSQLLRVVANKRFRRPRFKESSGDKRDVVVVAIALRSMTRSCGSLTHVRRRNEVSRTPEALFSHSWRKVSGNLVSETERSPAGSFLLRLLPFR